MNAKDMDLRRPEPTRLKGRAKTKIGIDRVRTRGVENMYFDVEWSISKIRVALIALFDLQCLHMGSVTFRMWSGKYAHPHRKVLNCHQECVKIITTDSIARSIKERYAWYPK